MCEKNYQIRGGGLDLLLLNNIGGNSHDGARSTASRRNRGFSREQLLPEKFGAEQGRGSRYFAARFILFSRSGGAEQQRIVNDFGRSWTRHFFSRKSAMQRGETSKGLKSRWGAEFEEKEMNESREKERESNIGWRWREGRRAREFVFVGIIVTNSVCFFDLVCLVNFFILNTKTN